MDLPASGHDPVLLDEVIREIDPKPGQTVIDCTVGRAGHATAIAKRLDTSGTLIALDADPRNLEFAQTQLSSAPCHVRLFHANFAELDDVMSAVGISAVHAILADLGISHESAL